MNALELLMRQHRDVESLFDRIEDAADASQARDLYSTLARQLETHMTIEEEIFYPAASEADEVEVSHAVDKHTRAKRIMQTIATSRRFDEEFLRAVRELKDEIQEHVSEEENQLFRLVEERFTTEELDSLAIEMKDLMDELAQRPERASRRSEQRP